MERLTMDTPKGVALKLDNPATEQEAKKQLMAAYLTAVNVLADYERTGLMPEEVAELAKLLQAKKQQRIAIIPCEPHQNMYFLEDDDTIHEFETLQMSLRMYGRSIDNPEQILEFKGWTFGAFLFLTEDEAKAAREARNKQDKFCNCGRGLDRHNCGCASEANNPCQWDKATLVQKGASRSENW